MIPNVSLRYSVPGVLLLLGLALTGASYYQETRTATDEIEQKVIERAAAMGNRIAGKLEFFGGRGDSASTELEVSGLGTTPDIIFALVADESDRVVLATDPSFVGRRAGEVAGAGWARQAAAARQTSSGQFEKNAAGSELSTAFPYRLVLRPGELRPARTGLLFLRFDLGTPKKGATAAAARRSLLQGALVLLLCALVWAYFNLSLTRRVAQLAEATRRLALGQLNVRLPDSGGDELAMLAGGFNRMAVQIQARTDDLERANDTLREEIVERERAQTALDKAQQQYMNLLDTVEGIVWEADARTWQFHFVSRQAERLLGYPVADWLASPSFWIEHIHPDDRSWAPRYSADCIRDKQDHQFEYRMIAADGRVVWLKDMVSVSLEEEPLLLRGLMVDITARKIAEMERGRLAAIVESTSDFVGVADAQGRVLFVNRAGRRMLGLSPDQVIESSIGDFHAPWATERVRREGVPTAIAAGVWQGETALLSRSGREIPVSQVILASKTPSGEVEFISTIMRDLSERQSIEEALRLSEERYRQLVEHAPEAIVLLDVDTGRFSEVNPVAEQLFGLSREQLLQVGPIELSPPMQPDGRSSAEAGESYIHQAIAGGAPVFEWIHRHASGRDVPCEIRLIRFDSPRGVQLRASIADISARKHAETERQLFERRLQETQKLESLGVLAGGIAHDFNNLLTGILGNASLAFAEIGKEGLAAECLAEIEKAGRRAGELCQQMLAYSGRGRFEVKQLDLSALVEDAASLLRHSISKTAILGFDLARNLPAVSADPTQLRQVLMNLVINASDAIGEENGSIRVVTGTVQADQEYLSETIPSRDLPSGQYVFLEVSDTGAGMTPETLARIFDPFFTTKFTGRGLGLAAVLGILRGHGGALKVDTVLGEGSSFRLLLPIVSGRVGRITPAPIAATRWRGEGTVLLVDDEEIVRNTTRRVLEKFGFEVVVAANGRAALARLDERHGNFAVTLLDLTMPELSGEQALRLMRDRWPGLKVLVMSGYSEHEVADRLDHGGASGFIQKPFTAGDLRIKLRELLGQ
jgi:PAS domain S-box-containing protein